MAAWRRAIELSLGDVDVENSSQMNTVEPAISLRTSCWLLPQNVQWSGFLVSPLLILFISEP